MKKALILLCIFGIVSCSKENSNNNASEELHLDGTMEILCNKVIKNLSIIKGPLTKSESLTVEATKALESSNEAVQPLYLIQLANNEGSAIISSDSRDGYCIYMMSNSNNCDYNDIEETNSTMSYFYRIIEDYRIHRICRATKSHEYEVIDTEVSNISRGPLITTHWSQNFPFNEYLLNFSPDAGLLPMGCGPVAVAQVMRYFNYPSSYLTHIFNWNVINTVIYSLDDDGSNMYQVSELIYAAGQATNANYWHDDCRDFAATTHNEIGDGLRSLGYSFDDIDFSTTAIVSSINNNRPVIMTGYDPIRDKAHAWIIDGYRETVTETRSYDENGNLIPSTELDDNAYDTTRKFLHVNYGWGGNNDGDKQYSRTIDRLNGEVFVYLDSNVFTYVVNNTLSAFNSCLLGFSNIHPNK